MISLDSSFVILCFLNPNQDSSPFGVQKGADTLSKGTFLSVVPWISVVFVLQGYTFRSHLLAFDHDFSIEMIKVVCRSRRTLGAVSSDEISGLVLDFSVGLHL